MGTMSPSRLLPALYGGLMGIALLLSGQTPELEIAPVRFAFYLVAEGTGVLLVRNQARRLFVANNRIE